MELTERRCAWLRRFRRRFTGSQDLFGQYQYNLRLRRFRNGHRNWRKKCKAKKKRAGLRKHVDPVFRSGMRYVMIAMPIMVRIMVMLRFDHGRLRSVMRVRLADQVKRQVIDVKRKNGGGEQAQPDARPS